MMNSLSMLDINSKYKLNTMNVRTQTNIIVTEIDPITRLKLLVSNIAIQSKKWQHFSYTNQHDYNNQ